MATVIQQTASPSSPTNDQEMSNSSPPVSGNSTPLLASGKRARSQMSLDLSTIPPLSQPAPPSNTLLITRLEDPKIFHPASLATIRQHINEIAMLNSFSPLKSMNRIICSFYDTDSAIKVRQSVDGRAFVGDSVAKCYFGEPTPIGDEKKYLDRPDAGRLFFISPPPSPPVGWEVRAEDPPNKQVHADDLTTKLEKLTGKLQTGESDSNWEQSNVQVTAEELQKLKASPRSPARDLSPARSSPSGLRSRSSTLIYDPKAHGDSPDLPAVMLETEDDSEVELAGSQIIKEHTARPPVELME